MKYEDMWIHEYMDTWIPGCKDMWIHVYMDIWIQGYWDAWINGYMDTWTQRYKDTWILIPVLFHCNNWTPWRNRWGTVKCCVTASDMAPGGVNKETGRGVASAYPAGHNLATVSIIVAFWWALDGGGGWVVSLMVVVGRKKQHGNVWATAATFGMTGAKGGIYFPFFAHITLSSLLSWL